MDHLLLPQQSLYSHPHIPLYSKVRVNFATPDGEAWLGYDERTGWDWDARVSTLQRCAGDDVDVSALAAFLQEWLFFGLAGCVLGALYDRVKFIDAAGYLTTRDLLPQLHQWSGSLAKAHPWIESEAGREKLLSDLRLNLEDAWAWLYGLERFEAAQYGGPFSDILLSIECLCKTLEHAIVSMQAISKRSAAGESVSQTPWSIQSRPWPSNSSVISRMVNDGWCPYTVHRLGALLGGTVLWYLSCTRRYGRPVSHTQCDTQGCSARKLVKETYKPRHVTEDCQCSPIGPPVSDMCAILDDDAVPLLRIEGRALKDANILLSSSKHHRGYVALSHVISDGWGNFKENKLPTCQLLYIQKLADDVSGNAKGTHQPLWIDSITVPLADLAPKHHLIAMERMVQSYTQADKVLVLDDELLRTPTTLPSDELQLRIAASDWMRIVYSGALLYDQSLTGQLVYGDPFDEFPTKVLCWTSLLQMQNIVGLSDFSIPLPQRFDVLMSLFRGRSTSISGDVPFVFCNLTKTDPAPILKLPYEHDVRQRHLATTQKEWPQSIVFYSGPRLHEYGYRWFLQSFVATDNLGGGVGSLRQEPYFAAISHGELGTVLPRGLLVSYSGFFFEDSTIAQSASMDVHIKGEHAYANVGAIYKDLAFGTSRYRDVAPGPSRKMGFVQRDYHPKPGTNNPAILVSIVDEDDMIVYCQYEWRLGLVLHTGEGRSSIAKAWDNLTAEDIAKDPKKAVAHRSNKQWCIG